MNKFKILAIFITVVLLFSILLTSCGQQIAVATNATNTTTVQAVFTPPPLGDALNGAGATLPAPLYAKWFYDYNKLFGVKINYQAIGSGGGIEQITSGTVDFGASDSIMSAGQQSLAESAFGPILHIPLTCGAVAVIYNIPGVASLQLKLTGDVLADIFLKKITKWNDSAIQSLNPDLKLPVMDIAVVHRSDGSGTTYIFTNYLCKVSNSWQSLVGSGTSVNWPGDIGGLQSAGVGGIVQATIGAIGYIELAYAQQTNLSCAKLQNLAGNWEEPSLEGATKAAEGITLPDDMKIMFTNSPNPDAYPICGFSWMLVYVNQTDKVKGTKLVNMLWWAIHDGQASQYTQSLSYAPLSPDVVKKAEAEILSIKYQGQQLLIP